jgi:hypothetical protein
MTAKKTGFSDQHIAQLVKKTEAEVSRHHFPKAATKSDRSAGPSSSQVFQRHSLCQAYRHSRRRVPCLHQLSLHHLQRHDSRHRV